MLPIMILTLWAKTYGRGAYQALCHETKLSYKTVLLRARDGHPSSYEQAERLSAATKRLKDKTGGLWSSIAEVRFPEKYGCVPVASSADLSEAE